MEYKSLKGMGIALITPFMADGSVDYQTLVQLVDNQLAGKADFFCVLGTTAETPTLSSEEQQAVIKTVIERVNGRVPILLGCGGNCTRTVVEQIHALDLHGVDALLTVVPYYNKPTQEGMFQHFKAIAAATELPIVLYNIPGRTGVNMLPETTLRLAREVKNIVAIKEASGKMDQIVEIIRHKPEGFEVLSGDDALAFPLIREGAAGVISVVGNALTEEFAQLVHLTQAGKFAEAEAIDNRLKPLYSLLFVDGNPAGIKALLHLQGILPNVLRLPLVPVSRPTEEQLSAFLATFH